MQNSSDIRKKANRRFFIKVMINTILILGGAVLITIFLCQLQYRTSLSKQLKNSKTALAEVTSDLEERTRNSQSVSSLYHNGNQEMLDVLQNLLTSGVMDYMSSGDKAGHELFHELADRSDVDYLFLLDDDGLILASSLPEYDQNHITKIGLLSSDNYDKLMRGTRDEAKDVYPVQESNAYDRIFFYSVRIPYEGKDYILVLGMNADTRESVINTQIDFGKILNEATVDNNGFMFAVNAADDSFIYYKLGKVELTGKNAAEAGLSRDAFQTGYEGMETINGTELYCVSEALEDGTLVYAAAETEKIFYNDRHVLYWTITIFLLVMFMCLIYTVIVRNDYIRNAVNTEKKIFYRWIGSPVIFDVSIFRKVFPLMITGVMFILGISFYSQTLLEISQTARESAMATSEVYEHFISGIENRQKIQEGHDNRYIAKARLIAYMLEEDPSVLNTRSEREYSYYDDDGNRRYRVDDEGNRLKSVSSSDRLEELCNLSNLESVYIFDESGRTIASNTENWYYTISHDPEDASYPFLEVLEGKKDLCIQDMEIGETDKESQYIGVEFHYYTTLDKQGQTIYLSRKAYEDQKEGENIHPITAHHSLLQVGFHNKLMDLTSENTEKSLSSSLLSEGTFYIFDNSADHICLYSQFSEDIGMKAKDLGFTKNTFASGEYYGFLRLNGLVNFLYSDYQNGYHTVAITPRSTMYPSRLRIAIITASISLLVILLLSVIVTLSTEEEEMLYATINEDPERSGINTSLLSILFPYDRRLSDSEVSARWNKRWMPWWQRSQEQKLSRMIDIFVIVLILDILITVIGADAFFPDYSVIRYILSGDWERGFNIFALSACVLVFIGMRILVVLLRIPLHNVSALLGTRSKTIGNLMLSVVEYSGALGAIFYCLYLLGMNPTSLLASAGVISLIIGLGAQSLINDILAGIFIVFEGEFRIGDIVTIGDFRGTVIDIGLRTTKILGIDGNIKIYNNSEISGILNMTKETTLAYCHITIEYGQDIDYVEAVLNRDLPKLRENNPDILSDPVCQGVNQLMDSGVELQIMVECKEENIYEVTRYVNKELLKIFYRNDIRVPFPNVTVSTLDTEDRKTIADIRNTESVSFGWWDKDENRTSVITLTNLGADMEDALHITEQLALFRGLDYRAALQLRLLAEELFSILRNIAGDLTASYWIVVQDTLYELHMRTQMNMTQEIREHLLDISTKRENEAARGFMGRLMDKIFMRYLLTADNLNDNPDLKRADPEDPVSDPEAGSGAEFTEAWIMSEYRSDIDSRRNQSAEAEKQWDELEKSIVARLADEVKVSMRGVNVEITIIKSFTKENRV